MSSHSEIPVVDLSACAVGSEEHVDPSKSDIQALADQIIGALETTGFVYLTNHGIPTSQMKDAFDVSRAFYSLSEEVKQKYARVPEVNAWIGWVGANSEKLHPKRPADYKESFNTTSAMETHWADADVPGFREKTRSLHHSCRDLCDRVLQLMGIGLKTKNFKLLTNSHVFGAAEDLSCLRLAHFPGLQPGTALEPDQIPMGEHAPYGSIALILQEQISGVEMRTRAGEFLPATRTDGAVVLILGYLMERWTADRLCATDMRTVMPESEAEQRLSRFSMFFFAIPKLDGLIECIDGSNKYPPITTTDFLAMKSKEIYDNVQ